MRPAGDDRERAKRANDPDEPLATNDMPETSKPQDGSGSLNATDGERPEASAADAPPADPPQHVSYLDGAESDPRRRRVTWRFGDPGPDADEPAESEDLERDIKMLQDAL